MTLNIFGQKYRVLKVKGELPLPGATAVCDIDNHVIYISAEVTGQEYIRCLLHEVGHAVIHRCSIDQGQMSHDMQEILCDTFAIALTENFRITPK